MDMTLSYTFAVFEKRKPSPAPQKSIHPVGEDGVRRGVDVISLVPWQAPQILCPRETDRAVKKKHVHSLAMPFYGEMIELGVGARPCAVEFRRRVRGTQIGRASC